MGFLLVCDLCCVGDSVCVVCEASVFVGAFEVVSLAAGLALTPSCLAIWHFIQLDGAGRTWVQPLIGWSEHLGC